MVKKHTQVVHFDEKYSFCDIDVVDTLYLRLHMPSAMVNLNETFNSNIISEMFLTLLHYLTTKTLECTGV